MGSLSWLGVVAAVLGWGSFTAPMKAAAVQRAQLHFLVFALYQALGIFLSSLLLLAFLPWSFTWWAVLSAAAWVPANMAAVLCVRFVGIAVGQAVWSGLVALVSFLWGQAYFHAHMRDPELGGLGIALLVLGIAALGLISGGGLGGGSGEAPHGGFDEGSALRLSRPDGAAEAKHGGPCKRMHRLDDVFHLAALPHPERE